MRQSFTLLINRTSFFFFFFFSSFFSSSLFAQQIEKVDQFSVFQIENKRSTKLNNWLSIYIKILLEESLSIKERRTRISADLSNIWRIKQDEANFEQHFALSGYFQNFNDLYSITLSEAKQKEGDEPFYVRSNINGLLVAIEELIVKIDSQANLTNIKLFPSSKDQNFRKVLLAEFARLQEPAKGIDLSYYQILIQHSTSWGHPLPFLLVSIPYIIQIYKMEASDKLGQFANIESIAFSYLQEFRKHSELKSLIALIHYLRDKNHDLMEKYSRSALVDNPNNDLATVLLALSLGLNTGEGGIYLTHYKKLNPWFRNPEIQEYYFGGIFKDIFLKEEPLESKNVANLLEQADQTEYDVKMLSAKTAISENRTQEAKQRLAEIIGEFPNEGEPRLLLSDIYMQENLHSENLKLFINFTPQTEDLSKVQKRIGESYYNLQNWSSAFEYYQQYLNFNPKDILVIHRTVISAINLNRLDEADVLLDKAIVLEPNNAETWRHKGEIAIRKGQIPQAKEYLRRSLSIDPTNAKVVKSLNRIQ